MYVILMVVFITFLISCLVMIIASILSKKTIMDREKYSPYECGFDPKGLLVCRFRYVFFNCCDFFLIFDVEITLLLPLAWIVNIMDVFSWGATGLFFIIILLFGLYYEWGQGALEWSN